MSSARNRKVAAVMAAHFVAAFAALGVPPYFGKMVSVSLGEQRTWLPGLLYVLPTVLTAVSSPFWGRMADRLGARPMLLRAQLGLALAFLLAGYASSTPLFAASLVLQGLVGGTFGASNAFLATFLQGRALRDSLTLMQGSARAALVVAPIAVGFLLPAGDPLRVYQLLFWLPLAAVLITLGVKAQDKEPAPGEAAPRVEAAGERPAFTAGEVFALQFLFTFATVVTFPYFLPHAEQVPGAGARGVAGVLFALPHLVYLLGAAPLSRRVRERPLALFAGALGVLAVSLVAQAGATGLVALVVARLLMGLAMTICFISLHGLVADVVREGSAGKAFGWFEASSKWGGVAAGCAAGGVSAVWGLASPFLLGAVGAAGAAVYVVHRMSRTAPAGQVRPAR
ncbi:MAG TPA: MFS transporter [Archangium sp.]|uniref:MFS transporter n=1 Tax=Archangium sp. TaxID=1872627 RepID=UPI002E2EF623|nr:MFS transporter [Archangium sp.]HEX5746333.1 MFS transporter [Archangium sp.]